MCFNVPHKDFWNFDKDSETMGANWQEIFQIFLLEVEIATRTALKMIERKGLIFNQQFKETFLRLTIAR